MILIQSHGAKPETSRKLFFTAEYALRSIYVIDGPRRKRDFSYLWTYNFVYNYLQNERVW